MFRRTILAGGLALAGSLLHAQQPTTPPVPEDALTPRELIAWSSLQTPLPAQQQLPSTPAKPNQNLECAQQPIGSSEPVQSQSAARRRTQDSAHSQSTVKY